jgi:phospholipase A1
MHTNARKLLLSSLLLSPPLLHAGEVEQQMLRCSVLGDASARLGCYDTVAKLVTATPQDSTVEVLDSQSKQKTAPAAEPAKPVAVASATPAPPEAPISRTVQLWELDSAAKRGRYAFRPHRDNYLLLANYSTSSNMAPFQEYTPAGLEAKRVELTYQLSFKMKLLEGIQDTPIDLWFGYTQQSFWQAYNRAASSPFRETNYQPELMAIWPINKSFLGIDLRYFNLGLVHQSNGQTSTLSRSWNRVYGEVGLERGNLAVTARLWKRLDNGKSDNDNPDITRFLGNGDVRFSYREHGHELSLLTRHNFSSGKGAVQAGWAFPVATNLKGYLQLFSGYGESLIDYNYSQKSLGAGFMVDF